MFCNVADGIYPIPQCKYKVYLIGPHHLPDVLKKVTKLFFLTGLITNQSDFLFKLSFASNIDHRCRKSHLREATWQQLLSSKQNLNIRSEEYSKKVMTSPGLVVMGGDSCKVRIPAWYTGWTFFTFGICCKIVMFL